MRAIDPASGSHGNSGIVIKYNFSPISAIVEQKVKPMGPFLTRLGGIVGGIFSTSGQPTSSHHLWEICDFRRL